MSSAEDDIVIKTPQWSFDSPAVHHDEPLAARHATYPFVASVRDAAAGLASLLFKVATDYMQRVPPLEAFPRPRMAMPDDGEVDFGWLPLSWGGGPDPAEDARGSFWVARERGATRLDRTAVLLAGNRLKWDGRLCSTGGAVGLRVVAHLGPAQDGRCLMRITAFSAAAPQLAFGNGAGHPRASGAATGVVPDPEQQRDLALSARAVFGFDEAPAMSGVAATGGLRGDLRLSGTGQRGQGAARRVYAWVGTVDLRERGRIVRESLVEQVSHAADPIAVTGGDPASRGPAASIAQRRPTRDARVLDRFRHGTALLPTSKAGEIELRDERVEVMPARIGRAKAPGPAPHRVPDRNPTLRSDDLSAVHAFIRAQEFFQRFDAYGLSARHYFKMARLPLRLQHRAGFRYASNGETVNAEVSPDLQGQGWEERFAPDARPQLRVAFGSANLSHRQLPPGGSTAGRQRPEPLGLAADPRWAWHEFGHVLNFASTGELEFRFAHSAGDALAAIVADPDSQLAEWPRLRGLTFPWAMLTRSHMRPVHQGWCWCGRRSRMRLSLRDGPPPMPGGYFEEQLMSSSLFRLYAVIGGTRPDPAEAGHARCRGASDYTVYLVMRAIALLGPAAVVPARSADQFVSALVDADAGTAVWDVCATWPEGAPARRLHRVGGMVHKVIRWAFEQQGLYATDDPEQTEEGLGRPPRVDIYIPGTQGRARGDYEPVPLAWSSTQPQPWHASADSISVQGHGRIQVQVRNRGRETAQGVSVRAWISPADAKAPRWSTLQPASAATREHISGQHALRTFSFHARQPGDALRPGRYLVLASASCEADRANTDPRTALPCADAATALPDGTQKWWSDPELLTDLVANDNNLGLRIVTLP